MRASEGLEARKSVGRVGVSDNEALGGPGTTCVSFRVRDELCTAIKRASGENEERCEGRNEKQGGVGAQTGLYDFLGNVAV